MADAAIREAFDKLTETFSGEDVAICEDEDVWVKTLHSLSL